MIVNKTVSKSKRSRIVLLLSILVSVFWILGQTLDIYHNAFVGAVFEAAWLPVIAATFVLAILSVLYWVKDKFNVRSLYLYSLALIVLTISVTIYFN
jgi:hypothetical protein